MTGEAFQAKSPAIRQSTSMRPYTSTIGPLAMQPLTFKSVNTLSHTSLVAYTREFLAQSLLCGIRCTNDKVKELIRTRDLPAFEGALAALVANDVGCRIDELEARRYGLWEEIIDTMDENLNLEIEDYTFFLSRVGLTETSALQEIPSYRASWELCAPGTRAGCRVFLSRRSAKGHFWYRNEMDVMIGRLIDPAHAGLCAEAGITERVDALAAIEAKIAKLATGLSRPGILIKVRECRYMVCLAMIVASFDDTHVAQIKDRRYVKAFTLFGDRIARREEQRRMELFSFNHLSPSAFDAILDALAPAAQREDALALPVLEDFNQSMAAYKTQLAAFRSHYLWERFETEETAFYQETLRLMDAVAGFIPCYDPDDPEVWEEHSTSATYQAALPLLEMLNRIPYDMFQYWEPDQNITSDTMQTMLDKWTEPENLDRLELLGCRERFERCRTQDDATRSLGLEIENDDPEADLDELRRQRDELTLILVLVKAEKDS
jgi:hypothetical protein